MAAFGLTPLDGLKSEVIDLSAADGDHLPLALKAELIEIFSGITEGLRHFYSILGKEGKSAPSTGSEAAGKVDKILKMLEIKREQLAAKKARAKGDSSLSMESKDAVGTHVMFFIYMHHVFQVLFHAKFLYVLCFMFHVSMI